MSDTYDNPNTPDFAQILVQRLAMKQAEAKPSVAGGFDPHKLFVQKKQEDEGKPVDTSNTVKWPEEDVKALEDFCQKYGVLGVNCGRMSPVAALAMLKNMMGIDDRPLEERVPSGYQKRGTQSKFNPHFPYEASVKNRQVLNG
jgi:hypothetical protein